MDTEKAWEGFIPPSRDYFKVPHEFIEAMSRINNMAELKVVLYLMRHTWGYQEFDEMKRITIDEFCHGRKRRDGSRIDSGTGLGLTAANDGIKKAVKHGFIEIEKDRSNKWRVTNIYRIKMRPPANGETQFKSDVEVTKLPNKKRQNDQSILTGRLRELRTMPYPEYLQTHEWKTKRDKALRLANFRCQLCNSSERLNVHHRTYERRGNELMGDLTVLCKDCHDTFNYNRELTKDG